MMLKAENHFKSSRPLTVSMQEAVRQQAFYFERAKEGRALIDE